MMKRVRHVLGISGGKDSAALAIYMKDKYPKLDIEYYTCDTGKELQETYDLLERLEVYLGKKIVRLTATKDSPEEPFDHFLKMYGGFLPSSNSRWCTKKLKLEPFEKFVGSDPVISYVGIRGDEEREGYISRKTNIQSIFPFRKNIWSEDVIRKFFTSGSHLEILHKVVLDVELTKKMLFEQTLKAPLTVQFNQDQKLQLLLDISIPLFNALVFEFLKVTSYPLGLETHFDLVNNVDILMRDDIFLLLENSGVGVPGYYQKVNYEINGEIGQYSRSRSGCFFCFFQQKIEWVWLYEQHPDLFQKAVEYEKDGYTWMNDERLIDIIQPERVAQIKEDFTRKSQKANSTSPYLLDILADAEGTGCAACFI